MSQLTKVVATIGPASNSPEVIRKLIQTGVNVFRQNFSHGSIEGHKVTQAEIRSIAKEEGKLISILQDLAGPKIRTGKFADDQVELIPGSYFMLTNRDIEGDNEKVSINYPELRDQLKSGDVIRLDDGKISLKVIEILDEGIQTQVINGGVIASKRGINVPGVKLQINVLTDKDKKSVESFIDQPYDWISLSFVQTAQDILDLRSLISDLGIKSRLIAKIETAEALRNLDDIISVSDGIMIARGDLAIETPVEQVPIVQKRIINLCRKANKPVIVATQMLESMIDSPVPTRAEVNDIANSIFDGTDAVMLSGETAAGNYPLQSVQTMIDVIKSTVVSDIYASNLNDHSSDPSPIAKSLCELSNSDVQAIVVVTKSGATAESISQLRPTMPVIAITDSEDVASKLNLRHAINPLVAPVESWPDNDVDIRSWLKYLLQTNKMVKKESQVIVSYGQSLQRIGGTDTITFLEF